MRRPFRIHRSSFIADCPSPQRSCRLKSAAVAASAIAFLVIALLSAGAAEPLEESLSPSSATSSARSLLDLLAKGGPVMIAIGLCSVVAVAVAFERLLTLRRERIVPADFMEGLTAAFGPDGTNVQDAIAYCERTPSALANVIRAGAQKLGRRLEIVEKAVEDAAAREVARMRRGLEALAVIGTIAPLLGLLGTIYGMISAFRTAAEQGLGRAEVLATGIYEALVTTAAGLTVAVPTLLVYYYLCGRVERLAEQIEQVGNEFLDQCHEGPVAESETPAGGQPPAEQEPGRWAAPAPDAGR